MTIIVNDNLQQFHLTNGRISMILRAVDGKLVNLYTGAAVPDAGLGDAVGANAASAAAVVTTGDSTDFGYLIDDHFRVQSATERDEDGQRFPEHQRFEYPEFGHGDYRHPAIEAVQPNGSRITDLRFAGYRVTPGKPALPGLPATFPEARDGKIVHDSPAAETLSIDLADELTSLTVTLHYTLFRDEAVIARSASIANRGTEPLTLTRAASFNLDLPDADYDMIEFTGAWAREREPHRQPLHAGIQQIESLRGASGPYFSPAAVFARPATTEDAGEAFGLTFVYSGNFDLHAEVDTYGATRLQLGINPFGFAWRLEPGESFQTPEALLGYTAHGLNALSQTFHRIVLDHLQRPAWARRERPVLINNWEATYFDFTEDQLLDLARLAKHAGIELFVLDDGWFGARTSDRSGLGDWTANPDRLPEGIAGIARKINEIGMQFGLWFEPEMVNKDSDLYRAHPEWVIATPGRSQSVYRHQYVLDFANPAVVDNIYAQMHAILSTANVAYIKWDMNRFITEAFDATRGAERQGELMHRYILGVYALYERLFAAFPDLIIEGCASGGSRFDYGILAYSPQAWTSDDTDAVERMSIQYGTSFFFPVATMGAHVSITPNHQTGRNEPLATRANVAMFGTFGYEMDLTSTSPEDLAEIADQVAFFKEHAPLLHNGDLYRLVAPYDHRRMAWMSVAADRAHAIVGDYVILGVPNKPKSRLRLRGLDETARYRVVSTDGRFDAVRSGGELMRIGIDDTDLGPDFASRVYLLDRV
ncbi:alpha-galactosidase [Bifidobacterium ramosum]|uniref:Alpha-galactosidase n=1 Tax=Bifidobacterium ramosum TaxID=1798158 RepID=A0A6L4WZH7_9BIFI|nr:alpha-galactosidase [Bifidobacterium ramosum]KAB8287173.1 alpha-galactosidase [Bifidobacterium ramosum]NEG71889.1 alpha-galactosidase [Bifidobacterium ramosum]